MNQQRLLLSGFGITSKAADVIQGIDLTGRTAIVTGGYSGLGRETVRILLAAGARVIVPSRDVPRARHAMASIPGAEVEPMDLLEPDSIDAFASRFVSSGAPLHLLINSAGIMACPLMRDARGFEYQFATNHLGHFQLTERLTPALVAARGARVISVSSRGHWISPVDVEDPNFKHRAYDPWLAYGQSKTANILFATELDRRSASDGIRAFSLHPGAIVETGLAKYMTRDQIRAAGGYDEKDRPVVAPSRGLKSVEQGAATIVWCAVSPSLDGLGGLYCEDNDVASISEEGTGDSAPSVDATSGGGVKPYAIDPGNARRLWELSSRLLNLNS